MKFILLATKIDLLNFAKDLHGTEDGAVVYFFGTARNSSNSSTAQVIRLDYEAYASMADAEMQRIFVEAQSKFGLRKALVCHRIGSVELGEAAVAIAVATAHRAEAFAACRYLIDELKKRLPIWKREFFADGSVREECHA